MILTTFADVWTVNCILLHVIYMMSSIVRDHFVYTPNRYSVILSLIGWAHSQNDPCIVHVVLLPRYSTIGFLKSLDEKFRYIVWNWWSASRPWLIKIGLVEQWNSGIDNKLTHKHGLTVIPAWINNYIHYKLWDGITYPFVNFNGATVEV